MTATCVSVCGPPPHCGHKPTAERPVCNACQRAYDSYVQRSLDKEYENAVRVTTLKPRFPSPAWRALTAQWAAALDRPSVEFRKIGESHFVVEITDGGVNVSYPLSVRTEANTSNRWFGVGND